MIAKDQKTSSTSEVPKVKSALLNKYKDDHQKEVDGYERLKTKEQVGSTCGLVLEMGPHCYDKEKFPEGPWCKKGDWVIFAKYAGSRIQIDGGEVRLLNDDEVLATIDKPEDILHQY